MTSLTRFLALAALTSALAAVQMAANPSGLIQKPTVVVTTGGGATKVVTAEAPAVKTSTPPTPTGFANLPSAPDGTRVQFSRRSDQEAARKLGQATAENVDQAEALAEDSLDYEAEVLSCGTEAFTKTEYNTHCLIALMYPSGYESSCSAAKIGNNRLATAAHCFYDTEQGGFATYIGVYCWGSSTCDGVKRTTVATHGIISPRFKSSNPDKLNKWDIAVLRTAEALPGEAFTLGQVKTASNVEVRMTGYPVAEDESACRNAEFDGCNQFSITDTMWTKQKGFYKSKMLSTCGGMSDLVSSTPRT